MKLSDLLIDDWVAVPLEARDLREALAQLLRLVYSSRMLDPATSERLVGEILDGTQGELIRVNDEIVLAAGRLETLEDVSVLLGIAPAPLQLPTGGKGPQGTARVLIVLLTPRRLGRLREKLVPTLARVLRDAARTARLLGAGSPMEVRGFKELMEIELHDRLLVEDAVTPLRYRIYPDTPLLEVVDLMVRRGLRAVPVVGESYEVLGIITVGDALKHLLPRTRSAEGDVEKAASPPRVVSARDVMTRTVMCVSEDQSLLEAANLMVNRDVEQLPVVREGELVGFLTRETILEMLFGTHGATGSSEL
jgi:CBS domain-containing protein